LFFSSGEFPLSEFAEAAGRKIRGGAEVRLINLPADAGAGLGIFESLHGEESPQRLAQRLKSAALALYGTPFRSFLEEFMRNPERHIANARRYITKFVDDNLPKDCATEVGRALQRFAVVGAAGEMASNMGVVFWEPGMASWAATRCFSDWIEYRGGIGQTDLQAAIRQVKAFIESNGASRFQSTITRMDNSGDTIHERVINRVGYWKNDDDGELLFLVFPETFRREVCAGFDAEAVAKELARQDLLVKGDGKNLTKRESIPDHSRRPRFYVIRAAILE
jgi:uncharacterized protein (DUF927 family)